MRCSAISDAGVPLNGAPAQINPADEECQTGAPAEIDLMWSWAISSLLANLDEPTRAQLPANVLDLVESARTLHPAIAADADARLSAKLGSDCTGNE